MRLLGVALLLLSACASAPDPANQVVYYLGQKAQACNASGNPASAACNNYRAYAAAADTAFMVHFANSDTGDTPPALPQYTICSSEPGSASCLTW